MWDTIICAKSEEKKTALVTRPVSFQLDIPKLNIQSLYSSSEKEHLFECTICSTSKTDRSKTQFFSLDSLLKHYLEHDKSKREGPKPWVCNKILPDKTICGKIYKNNYELSYHRFRSHDQVWSPTQFISVYF